MILRDRLEQLERDQLDLYKMVGGLVSQLERVELPPEVIREAKSFLLGKKNELDNRIKEAIDEPKSKAEDDFDLTNLVIPVYKESPHCEEYPDYNQGVVFYTDSKYFEVLSRAITSAIPVSISRGDIGYILSFGRGRPLNTYTVTRVQHSFGRILFSLLEEK